ncbi:MAG: FAD-binding oxidoreductase [Planctomycetes bacterium]|nr:FAD-binding oxidoreductase [Planctomycetota bacterium]
MLIDCHVAILGGGVIGLAVARDLARAGVKPTVLLERQAAPGQGSTSRANGGVRAQWTTRCNIEFSKFTIAELVRLQEETKGLPGFIQAGYLFLTGTDEGETALRQGYELQRSCEVPVEWLSPKEVLERAPYVRGEGLRAGTFCGTDGLVDPHGVVQALRNQAITAGAELRFQTDVTAIRFDRDRFLLSTSRGEFRSQWLVNAAGPDAAEVAAMLGVEIPVRPVRRNLACTEPMDGYPAVIPMCVDRDTGVLIRRESGGFLLAYSDPREAPGRDTNFDTWFLEQVAERIGNRFPFLFNAPIDRKKCWAGLYPETPDHHAIVGPTPTHPRFLLAVGFGGHGIMHSLAAGRAIREIVTEGESRTLDIRPFRLSRFAEADLTVETAVL